MARLQELEHLVEQAALRHIGQQGLGLDQRFRSFGFELETELAELGRKTHGADDAHRIFAVACDRVTDHAQGVLFGVLNATMVVHHDLRLGVVIHRVDREVAARGVFVLRPPHVVAQHTATRIHRMLHAFELALAGAFVAFDLLGSGVVEVGTEGGNFYHLVFTATAVHHMHDAKAPPNDEGPAKQALDLFGGGVGGHVKVFGAQAQQQVTHSAAHDVGLKTRLLQGAHHIDSALVHQVRVDAVHTGGHFGAATEIGLAACRLAQQFGDEFFDHS